MALGRNGSMYHQSDVMIQGKVTNQMMTQKIRHKPYSRIKD